MTTMPNVRKTISLPEPLYKFALAESKELNKREKGEAKENVSMLVASLLREAREKKKAA